MANMKNYSLFNQFKCLSKKVFKHLETDKRVNHQTSEETITDILVRQLKVWKNANSTSKFNVSSFSKRAEAQNGADFEWDWYFVDSSGKKWLGFRIQAKVLDIRSQKFKQLDHKNAYGAQFNNLQNVSYLDNRIPFYCFYLYKQGISQLNGCSLASLSDIKPFISSGNSKNANKRSATLNNILAVSFPWHMLFCFIEKDKSQKSLPEKVVHFLNSNLDFKGEINFLTNDQIESVKNMISTDSETDLTKFITIFSEKMAEKTNPENRD